MAVRVARSSARFEGGGTRLFIWPWLYLGTPHGGAERASPLLERESDIKPELCVSLDSSPLSTKPPCKGGVFSEPMRCFFYEFVPSSPIRELTHVDVRPSPGDCAAGTWLGASGTQGLRAAWMLRKGVACSRARLSDRRPRTQWTRAAYRLAI